MDRIRRRQIDARPFLRPALFSGFFQWNYSVPFQVEVVNEGNAMNLTSGIFTAPRLGIYFFSFTGLALFPASSDFVE
jgi:hypothetical protein